MGPYSAARQERRRQALIRILRQPMSTEMRAIWIKHLNNLATDEGEYYRRVRETYQNMVKWENPFDEQNW